MASSPLRSSAHEVTELEFHISPVRNSSLPHTGIGIVRTSASKRWQCVTFDVRRVGLETASARSGIVPSAQQWTSYLKSRYRPAQRVPTAPSPTTPRSQSGIFHTGVISTTNECGGKWIINAE
jgi:hypothetical protein